VGEKGGVKAGVGMWMKLYDPGKMEIYWGGGGGVLQL
jgi:hypothetical protein